MDDIADVIGEASIRVDALTTQLKQQINRDLNDALRSVKADTAADPLVRVQEQLRTKSIDLAEAEQRLGAAQREVTAAETELTKVQKVHAADSDEVRGATERLTNATIAHARATDNRDKVISSAHTLWQRYTSDLDSNTKGHVVAAAAVKGLNGVLDGAEAALPRITTLMRLSATAGAGMAAISLGTGAVANLTTALIPAVGYLAQLSGAALLIPAALASVGAVALTAKVGLSGVGDALKLLNSDTPLTAAQQKQLNDELGKLAPSARDAVKALADLHKQFLPIQKDVQQELFFGLSRDLQTLGKTLLPVVHTGMQQVAESLNDVIDRLLKFAGSKESARDLGQIFLNTASATKLLSPGITGVADGLKDIATIGSNFLPGIASALGKAGQNFSDFTSSARGSKEIQVWIADAIQAIKDFGNIAGNVGNILKNVFDAARIGAGSVGGGLKDLVQQVRDWTDSFEGQKSIAEFFASTRQLADALAPVLLNIVQLIAQDLAPAIADIARTVGPHLLGFVQQMQSAFDQARPSIHQAAEALGQLIDDLGPHLPAVVSTVFQLATAGIQVLDAFTPLLGPITAVAGAIAHLPTPILEAIVALGLLAKIRGPISSALGSLAPLFGKAGKDSGDAFGKGGSTGGGKFVSGLKSVIGAAGWVGLGLGVADSLTGPLISRLTRGHYDSIIDAAAAAPGLLLDAMLHGTPVGRETVQKLFGIPTADEITRMIQDAADAATPAVGKAATEVAGGWNYALSGMVDNTSAVGGNSVGALLGAIAPAPGAVGGVAGQVSGAWSLGMNQVPGITAGALAGVPGIVGGALAGANGAASAGVGSFLGTISGMNGAPGIVGGAVNGIPGIVGGALAGAVGQANGGIGGFLGAISGANRAGGIMAGAAAGVRSAAWVDLNPTGQAVAQGFADGITARAKAAIQAAKQMVAEAVAIAKAAAGVHSPSTVFRGIGLNIAQGLALGVDAGATLAVDSTRAMVDAMATTAIGIPAIDVGRVQGGDGSSAPFGLDVDAIAAAVAAGAEAGSRQGIDGSQVLISQDELVSKVSAGQREDAGRR